MACHTIRLSRGTGAVNHYQTKAHTFMQRQKFANAYRPKWPIFRAARVSTGVPKAPSSNNTEM